MAKLPNFSELSKKLDLHGIVDSFKSAIGSGPTKIPTGDDITVKFAELGIMVQKLSTTHAEQSQALADLYTKINNLAKEVQTSTIATPLKTEPVSPVEQPLDPKDDDQKRS